MMRAFANSGQPAAESMLRFEPLPPPTGSFPYRLDLADVIDVKPIIAQQRMVVHTVGDTGGVLDPHPQMKVVELMLKDALGHGLDFFYHLGDVVYFTGDAASYYPQFYEPYADYPAPIFAIPGNHDGATLGMITQHKSLEPFVANFCAKDPVVMPEAFDAHRHTMTQPNVYWTLLTPLATFIGLYTNVPEGGIVRSDQQLWLTTEMEAAPKDKALIVALHHPPMSNDRFHSGSAAMLKLLIEAANLAKRAPNLVLAGHVHNYQRFELPKSMFAVPTVFPGVALIVAGAGGYHNLHKMAKQKAPELKMFNDKLHGYLTLAFTPGNIHGVYRTVDGAAIDVFDVSF